MRNEDVSQGSDKCFPAGAYGVAMAIRKTSHAVTRLYNDTLKPTGLRVTQFATLATLQALGPSDVKSLADALGVDRTTLVRNLRLLEDKNLVEIVSGPDRRQRIVTLTPHGTRALQTALPLWETVQSKMIESIGQKEWSALSAELTTIAERARQIMSR